VFVCVCVCVSPVIHFVTLPLRLLQPASSLTRTALIPMFCSQNSSWLFNILCRVIRGVWILLQNLIHDVWITLQDVNRDVWIPLQDVNRDVWIPLQDVIRDVWIPLLDMIS
jgi:hypothetical protein